MIGRQLLTPTYVNIGTGVTFLLLQATDVAEVFVGLAAPTATDTGLLVTCRQPLEFPHVATLGGGVWVRGNGVIRYARN